MASISVHSASRELLDQCLAGDTPSTALIRAAIAENDGRALLRVVVEQLADLFDPALCETYARLFVRVIELVRPEYNAGELFARFQRVRQPRRCLDEPRKVFVLSRVTLGADVAVTSVVLDAMKRRFPQAAVFFVGSRKNFELFASDPRIGWLDFEYPRGGSLAERLTHVLDIDSQDSIVVDPDSRLTQLGLLPVCDENRYYFFESRSYGADSSASLVELTRRWVRETFGVNDARAYIAPSNCPMQAEVAVSFGVGDNEEKRVPDPFEEELIRWLAHSGRTVIVDEGAGGEESARVRRIASRYPSVRTWRGSYAPFASIISKSKLYVGYDSAGQHVAASCGVPLVSVFAGFASDRMFHRWRPDGSGSAVVIKVSDQDHRMLLEQTIEAIQNLTL